MFGYKDVDDYYRDASPNQFIRYVTTPTLFLAAEDDPFLGAVPVEEFRMSEGALLVLSRQGGHVAFFESWWPPSEKETFMDKVVLDFLSWQLKVRPSDNDTLSM